MVRTVVSKPGMKLEYVETAEVVDPAIGVAAGDNEDETEAEAEAEAEVLGFGRGDAVVVDDGGGDDGEDDGGDDGEGDD